MATQLMIRLQSFCALLGGAREPGAAWQPAGRGGGAGAEAKAKPPGKGSRKKPSGCAPEMVLLQKLLGGARRLVLGSAEASPPWGELRVSGAKGGVMLQAREVLSSLASRWALQQ